MIKHLRTSIILLTIMTGLLGGVYPIFIWGFGNLFFSPQTNGSLIQHNLKTIGSSLIGQEFKKMGYFWSRLSATPSYPYNAQNSGSNHLNADHPELLDNARKRLAQLKGPTEVPIDLVTTSASGLDPHISPQAAIIQVNRIAKRRDVDPNILLNLIKVHTETPFLGFLGKPHVNVLLLNLSLDKIKDRN